VGVLSGNRVLDVTDEKGTFCTRLLADMDADVIRIERPGRDQHLNNPDYCYLNAGKRSISLDIEKPAGRELFRRLITKADILVETFRPDYLTSLGLGYDDLAALNPRLVMASVTGFGQSGPYRDYNCSDLVAAALGGWLSVCGETDTPLVPYGSQAYRVASLFAANGIMLALWRRHESGRGQYIDISLIECVAAALDHVLPRWFSEGTVSGRQDSRHWNNAFDIFPCKDGAILLSLFQQWDTLVELLASEGMVDDLADEKWRDREKQERGIDHIVEVLGRWTATHAVDELVELGQLMRFPWAKVASVADVLESPQLAARDFFGRVECINGTYTAPGAPVKMGVSPWKSGGKVPVAGEHAAAVYRDELGLSGEELDRLRDGGVI